MKTVVVATLALTAATAAFAAPGGHAIPIPEPSDALLVLMGAAGIFIGRRLHAQQKKKSDD